MPGDPAPLQELVSQLLLPQPGGYMTGSLDLPPVTEIGLDAAYVLCADDIAVSRLSMAEVVRGGTPRPFGMQKNFSGTERCVT